MYIIYTNIQHERCVFVCLFFFLLLFNLSLCIACTAGVGVYNRRRDIPRRKRNDGVITKQWSVYTPRRHNNFKF